MGWGDRVAAVSFVLLHASSARAAEPACFPERTVLATTKLEDAAGNVIGTIRGGKQVNVIAEHVGPKGSLVEISISEPAPLRAFVGPETLLVFLREDFPLEANRTWWIAGTPMRIFAGDARRAEVTGDDAEEGAPKLVVRCSLLTGSVAADRVLDDQCHCQVLAAARNPAGEPVWWEDGHRLNIEIGKGYPSLEVDDSLGAGLLERKGNEVLIEILDPFKLLRVRRWVSAEGMKTGTRNLGFGVGSMCEEIDQPLGQRGARLTRAVPVRAEAGAEPFTVLPATTEYRVLEVRPPDAKIIARWPSWALDRYTLDVKGWVPTAMLPVPADTRPSRRAVVGRIVLAPGLDPKRLATLAVVTRDMNGEREPTFRARVRADGRFFLPVETVGPPEPAGYAVTNAGSNRVEVTSPSGDLAGVEEEAVSLPGGADEVVITVGPAVEIKGRLESRTGALVPGAPVNLLEKIVNASTRTGPDGRFRFLVPPDKYALENGDDSFADVDAVAPASEVVVRQRRRPWIFGSVPRRSDGQCIATRINTRTPSSDAGVPDAKRSFPVDLNCRYTADDLPRENNATELTLDVPSSPLLLRATYPAEPDAEPVCFDGPCPPGVPDASLFVELADARGVLLGTGRVEARADGALLGECQIRQGHCHIHHLVPDSDVVLSSRSGAHAARANVHLSAGVNEVLLRSAP